MTSSPTEPALTGPFTLIFKRHVKPGREATYIAWVKGIQEASRHVRGFLGASTIAASPEDPYEYTSVVRFDSLEALRAWEESELHHEWYAKLPTDCLAGDVEIRRLEGLEFWFTAPGVTRPMTPPSPHKMALVIFVVVFLLVTSLSPLLRYALGNVPLVMRTLIMVALQVGLMTYVIMPRVTSLLAPWLFSQRSAKDPSAL